MQPCPMESRPHAKSCQVHLCSAIALVLARSKDSLDLSREARLRGRVPVPEQHQRLRLRGAQDRQSIGDER